MTTLSTNSLYFHNGVVMLAISDTHLLSSSYNSLGEEIEVDGNTHIACPSGSDQWKAEMIVFAKRLAAFGKSHANEAARLRHRYTLLGEALLEKAVEKDWCDEYDDFAEEWDLPSRIHDYEVTVAVVVRAESEDDAIEYVGERVRLCDDGTASDPEFSASRI